MFLIITIQILLLGCAGVGVFESNDPLVKLNDANHLYSKQNRPLIAEKLIFEAITIYASNHDNHGLGNSHREYGDLLLSPSISEWEKVYRESGFYDESVTFDNRAEKAKEHYKTAIDFYTLAEPKF